MMSCFKKGWRGSFKMAILRPRSLEFVWKVDFNIL